MKPTIYLGLGGTGNLGISYAKKLFEQEGSIPDHVAFLGIDYQTDMDDNPDLASDIHDDFMKIAINANPRQIYQVGKEQRGEYQWMFSGNERYIAEDITDGASQVRTTGRLYSEMVLDRIMARLKTTINDVKSVTGSNDVEARVVNIHMVMSIAGGTGAGSFITIANAIRKQYGNQVKLFGYGISHNVFRAMDPQGNKTPNVDLNCVSSIIDMDYIMSASIENPVEIKTGNTITQLTSPLFDLFYVVDNTSESGFVVNNIKNLSEIVGTCLYSCGSEIGSKLDAVLSNIGPALGYGNVGRKLGWVQTLGACQVVYKGDLLAKLYSLKASNILVNKMLSCNIDVQKAKDWTIQLNILEDGEEFNLLTDSIVSPKVLNSLKVPNLDEKQTEKEIKEIVAKYLVTLPELPSQEILKTRLEELKGELNKQVSFYLSSDRGIGNALKFLECLNIICNRDKIEMEEEMSKFNTSIEEKTEQLPKVYSQYQEEVKSISIFATKKAEKRQGFLEDIVGRHAKAILKDTYESKRREVARNIYVGLMSEIEVLTQKLKAISQKMTNLISLYDEEIEKGTSASSSALVFEYDLSYDERQNLTVDPNTVVVSDFISKLGASLIDINDSELEAKIEQYTQSLEPAEKYRTKLITDVIDNLPLEEYNKLKKEIDRKADRWLSVNNRGQKVTMSGTFVSEAISSSWLVTYYSKDKRYKTRFQSDKAFLPDVVGKEFLQIDKEAAKQRIIFCRLEGSIIPYCIGFLDDMTMNRYQRVVNQVNSGDLMFMPHFDKTLFEKMRDEDFKLKPEMKNETIFYWVCGQLFGFRTITEDERIMENNANGVPLKEISKESAEHTKYICWYRGRYVFYDELGTPGKDDRWVSMDNTRRRDTAYNYFKTMVLPERKDSFKRLISTEFARRQEWWKLRIEQIINDGFHNYINKLVCSDKNSLTYFARESGEVAILTDEWAYIEKELYNALLNLR